MGTLLSRYQGSILPELGSRLPTIQTEHQGQSLPLLAPKWLVPIPISIVSSGLIPGRPKVSQLANRLIVQCGMLKIRVTISSVGSVAKQRRWREGKAKGNTKRWMEERAAFLQATEGRPERKDLGVKRTTAPILGTFLSCCRCLGRDEPSFF